MTASHDRLAPWPAPGGNPGWRVTTRSRRLAVAVAGTVAGGTAGPDGNGGWQARIPAGTLPVTAVSVDAEALWCRLGGRPDSGALAVVFAPWTPATVLKCPVSVLPARGTLSVRDVRITTRMGRTVRYLVPQFNPS